MPLNLSLIRQFTYKSDRQRFGMIGTVTLRDPSLNFKLKGSPSRRGGKPLERVTKPQVEGLFLGGIKGMTGGTGLPAMPVPRVQGLHPKICQVSHVTGSPCFGNRRSRMRWVDLVGKWACPTDASFSVPCSCAARSCKIDIQVDNYMFYLIMKPPRPNLNIML